ncbi:MAG: hypothetical protein GY828_02315 [Candidatus Gracilibacteria bacterium]|nr:hypothetical protein [Candidatus Gracilibacteria bacterium]
MTSSYTHQYKQRDHYTWNEVPNAILLQIRSYAGMSYVNEVLPFDIDNEIEEEKQQQISMDIETQRRKLLFDVDQIEEVLFEQNRSYGEILWQKLKEKEIDEKVKKVTLKCSVTKWYMYVFGSKIPDKRRERLLLQSEWGCREWNRFWSDEGC